MKYLQYLVTAELLGNGNDLVFILLFFTHTQAFIVKMIHSIHPPTRT